jgi:hypothetical protein
MVGAANFITIAGVLGWFLLLAYALLNPRI